MGTETIVLNMNSVSTSAPMSSPPSSPPAMALAPQSDQPLSDHDTEIDEIEDSIIARKTRLVHVKNMALMVAFFTKHKSCLVTDGSLDIKGLIESRDGHTYFKNFLCSQRDKNNNRKRPHTYGRADESNLEDGGIWSTPIRGTNG